MSRSESFDNEFIALASVILTMLIFLILFILFSFSLSKDDPPVYKSYPVQEINYNYFTRKTEIRLKDGTDLILNGYFKNLPAIKGQIVLSSSSSQPKEYCLTGFVDCLPVYAYSSEYLINEEIKYKKIEYADGITKIVTENGSLITLSGYFGSGAANSDLPLFKNTVARIGKIESVRYCMAYNCLTVPD